MQFVRLIYFVFMLFSFVHSDTRRCTAHACLAGSVVTLFLLTCLWQHLIRVTTWPSASVASWSTGPTWSGSTSSPTPVFTPSFLRTTFVLPPSLQLWLSHWLSLRLLLPPLLQLRHHHHHHRCRWCSHRRRLCGTGGGRRWKWSRELGDIYCLRCLPLSMTADRCTS